MSAWQGHQVLLERLLLSGRLICDSALHVGTGEAASALAGTDMPVARDGAGRPYIPGSSLRGALRSSLEAVVRGLNRPDLRVCDPFAADDKATTEEKSCSSTIAELRKDLTLSEQEAFDLAWENACEICRLFGHAFLASRVRIADLPLTGAPIDTYTRDGVGLDRDLRTASKGILYNFEAVPAGAAFQLRLEIDSAAPHEVGLVLAGLDFLTHGLLTLGGKASRGLGRARLVELEARRWRVEDFFSAGEGTVLDSAELDALRNQARQHYLEGGGDVSQAV